MSARDRLEVAVRNQVNRAFRVPMWRRAAGRALAQIPERGGPAWREGLAAWAAGRTDPPLTRAQRTIENERAAMLRDSTSIRDGKTSLTDIANACNKMSSPRQLGELLYWLVKTSGASAVLELGTALGFSAAYMAAALPADGVITTIERRPVVARRAQVLFTKAGFDGRVRLEVGDFFKIADRTLAGDTFDAMFKDGAHTRKATEEFFDRWAPRCVTGAMVIFDDLNHGQARSIDSRQGMDRAWASISSSPRVAYAANLYRPGVISLR